MRENLLIIIIEEMEDNEVLIKKKKKIQVKIDTEGVRIERNGKCQRKDIAKRDHESMIKRDMMMKEGVGH